MKKLKKLHVKKVTLRDLDIPTMRSLAGGAHTLSHTCTTCPPTCGACGSYSVIRTCAL